MLVQGKICPFLVKPVNIILLLFSINFKEASSKIKDLSRTLFAIEKLISSMEAVLSGSFASFKSLLIFLFFLSNDSDSSNNYTLFSNSKLEYSGCICCSFKD